MDALLLRSPGFFVGKSVVIDLYGLTPTRGGFLALLDELSKREIRILGVEGADPTSVKIEMPYLTRGRTDIEKPTTPVTPAPAPALASSLLIDTPVRSGRLLVHSEGDVTVVGSVASGAEGSSLPLAAFMFMELYAEEFWRDFTETGTLGFLSKARSRTNGHRWPLHSGRRDRRSSFRRAPIQAWLDRDELKITTMS